MHIFYLPSAATAGPVILSEEESKHSIRVLRLDAGSEVLVTNGKGQFFKAQLLDAHPKRAVLQLEAPYEAQDQSVCKLHLAVAPTKNMDRLEWMVEKAVEIGVDAIHFFTSYHSERRQLNTERLEKIAIAAMKQSQKSRLPALFPLESFEAMLERPFVGDKFIAWIDESVSKHLGHCYSPNQNCWVLIGPEGDFSQQEVAKAQESGFLPVSLGPSRLRTETAAIAALHTLQLMNQLHS
jgi:16S rRNA (uracil1498-N3)-methyltransferase